MVEQKKVFIATPMYGGMCTADFTCGLLDTAVTLTSQGHKCHFVSIGNESLITRGRNQLVADFLETDAEYFVFIDADIGFKATDVIKLLESGKDVICGLYPKKFVDWQRINRAAAAGHTDLQNFAASFVADPVDPTELKNPDAPLTSPVVEIKHGGTGFMLIRRRVFDQLTPFVKQYRTATIKDEYGKLPPLIKEFFALDIVDEDNYLLSEDYFFCRLWRTHGGKVYADLSIKLTHTGTYQYNGSVFVGGLNSAAPQSNKG